MTLSRFYGISVAKLTWYALHVLTAFFAHDPESCQMIGEDLAYSYLDRDMHGEPTSCASLPFFILIPPVQRLDSGA